MNKFAAVFRYWRWYLTGKPVPPPHSAKQELIRSFAGRYNLRVLVDTGTFRGDMVDAMRGHFDQIVSIELDDDLFERARQRFLSCPTVRIVHGDSSKVLPSILAELSQPCLFWLDGHYSGSGTALGDQVSPILDELAAILRHPVRGHLILVDDARLFTGRDGYPTLEQVRLLALSSRPDLICDTSDDIIHICPGDRG